MREIGSHNEHNTVNLNSASLQDAKIERRGDFSEVLKQLGPASRSESPCIRKRRIMLMLLLQLQEIGIELSQGDDWALSRRDVSILTSFHDLNIGEPTHKVVPGEYTVEQAKADIGENPFALQCLSQLEQRAEDQRKSMRASLEQFARRNPGRKSAIKGSIADL